MQEVEPALYRSIDALKSSLVKRPRRTVNNITSSGNSLLWHSVDHIMSDRVKLLLELGANPNITKCKKFSPLYKCISLCVSKYTITPGGRIIFNGLMKHPDINIDVYDVLKAIRSKNYEVCAAIASHRSLLRMKPRDMFAITRSKVYLRARRSIKHLFANLAISFIDPNKLIERAVADSDYTNIPLYATVLSIDELTALITNNRFLINDCLLNPNNIIIARKFLHIMMAKGISPNIKLIHTYHDGSGGRLLAVILNKLSGEFYESNYTLYRLEPLVYIVLDYHPNLDNIIEEANVRMLPYSVLYRLVNNGCVLPDNYLCLLIIDILAEQRTNLKVFDKFKCTIKYLKSIGQSYWNTLLLNVLNVMPSITELLTDTINNPTPSDVIFMLDKNNIDRIKSIINKNINRNRNRDYYIDAMSKVTTIEELLISIK